MSTELVQTPNLNETQEVISPPANSLVREKMKYALQFDAMNMMNTQIIRECLKHDCQISLDELDNFRLHPWYANELKALKVQRAAANPRSASDMAEMFEHVADAAYRAEQFGAASGALGQSAKLRGHMERDSHAPGKIVISWGGEEADGEAEA